MKTAYDDYMEAWAAAYAPVPGCSGSGKPYWCADMSMHMLSHWEELVSYMLFRNKSRLNAENMDCFLLSLPGKEVNDFANSYIKKLSIALKLLEGEGEIEELDVEKRLKRNIYANTWLDCTMRACAAPLPVFPVSFMGTRSALLR